MTKNRGCNQSRKQDIWENLWYQYKTISVKGCEVTPETARKHKDLIP